MVEKHTSNIYFLGAAETVTGSKFLLQQEKQNILIDCGLFQGIKKLRNLNWDYLPIDPKKIDFIVLTHGHLDHVGYLPKLIKQGFKGAVYGSAPTLDVAEIILKDSAKIQEEEAKRANKEGYSSHHPAEPLYTLEDAYKAIEHFNPLSINQWHSFAQGTKVRLQCIGHILGATFVEIHFNEKRFVFSGDIGRKEDDLMYPPKKPEFADYIITESTYGGRIHPKDDISKKLKTIIMDTIYKEGTLLIPSFAVERTQTLMLLLWKLMNSNAIPKIPMYLDSPMGANVLQLFSKHIDWHKLDQQTCDKMCDSFHIVSDFKETQKIIENKQSKIVIAGSGMITGGRILSYLQTYLELKETSILLVGYQAEGTRGRSLLEGCDELKVYGNYYKVKADIYNESSLSAHADQSEIIDWLSDIQNTPEKVFILHGEPHSADALRLKIKDQYQWNVEIPELYSIHEV